MPLRAQKAYVPKLGGSGLSPYGSAGREYAGFVIAFVGERSRGAGDPHDRGVAEAVVEANSLRMLKAVVRSGTDDSASCFEARR